MFLAVGKLSEDLRSFIAAPGNVSLPFTFVDDQLGTAIIQIAGGKAPVGLFLHAGATDPVSPDDLREAAQRFVAKVMLHTTSDLFTVLGVAYAGEATTYRDNYRRLMAMVHPDARPTGFPSDAAIRVNHAYAVLSDAEQLANYKTRLEELRGQALAVSSMGAGARAQRASRPISEPGFAVRIGALLLRARERGLLLWLALLLLVPVGGALYLTLSETPHVRLVETRPSLGDVQVAVAPAPPVASGLSAPAVPVARVNEAANGSSENAMPKAPRKQPSELPLRPNAPTSSQPSLTPVLRFETSLSTSRLAALVQPTSNVPSLRVSASPAPPSNKGITSLAPVASIESANVATPTREANVDQATNVAIVRPASVVASNATSNAPIEHRVSPADASDVLVMLSNAYESGSVAAFSNIFAPTMTARRQVLSDYERLFQQTQQRSIRFTDFKHKANGQRILTSGNAVVSTVDNENRASRRRIFLEIEISRTPDGLKIERLHNFPLD